MKTTITLLLYFLLINCSYAQVKNETSNLNTEVDAEFPGGMAGLFAFLRENIKYPDEAYKLPTEGEKVKVRFVIDQKGEIEHARIIKEIPACPSCGVEVLRVIKLMPTWKPAVKNGINVKSYFDLPVTFKPDEKETNSTKKSK